MWQALNQISPEQLGQSIYQRLTKTGSSAANISKNSPGPYKSIFNRNQLTNHPRYETSGQLLFRHLQGNPILSFLVIAPLEICETTVNQPSPLKARINNIHWELFRTIVFNPVKILPNHFINQSFSSLRQLSPFGQNSRIKAVSIHHFFKYPAVGWRVTWCNTIRKYVLTIMWN